MLNNNNGANVDHLMLTYKTFNKKVAKTYSIDN
ncbi:hypothetical protein DI53_2129 [Sphingobacterium deserti]|uniref:Uncharacterized protein n=1 Tax=Sphingobacterium deserti TaxID=1229276 RepID=A0A0B8T0J1_9SPHI|nr:hypothetical protein DI53_2129 [Sphingobacterium deserti]